MLCPFCQTENSRGSRLCAGCGNKLDGVVAAMPDTFVLAGRVSRLLAAILDVVLSIAFLVIGGLMSPIWGPFALFAFLILQMILLTIDGQTVGKKAAGIRIVKSSTGENGGFFINVLLRWVVSGILGIIPFYVLVDILFIFQNDRRCIHDMIAGTQVVKA